MLSDIPGLKELLGDGSVTPNPDGLTVLEIANRVGNFFGVPPQIFDAIAVIDKVNDIANLLTGASPTSQLNLTLGDFQSARRAGRSGRRHPPGRKPRPTCRSPTSLRSTIAEFRRQPAGQRIMRQAPDRLFTSAEPVTRR